MHTDLLFESDRFNLSEVKPHFINPICFGEDVAAWLRSKLIERGIATIAPDQEDWGWYIEAAFNQSNYFLGIGGNAEESGSDPNQGEWRIMVEKKRSLADKLFQRNVVSTDDPMFRLIAEIIYAEPDFKNARVDAGA